MRFLSLFSGIEAASTAWADLGWECVGFSEIESFPCELLSQRHPGVRNLGDVTKITEADILSLGHIDLVVFGSPCQDLSVAGKQKGLSGARSGLFFTAIQIVQWAREWCDCRFALWENVPGAFSSNSGRDFAAVVDALSGVAGTAVPPKGWGTEGCAVGPEAMVEWATLDAQWFGVAQRRRRVFAIADFGDWRSRPPILLESEGLRGDTAPSRETGQSVAGSLSARTKGGGGLGTDFECGGGLVPKLRPVLTSSGDISHCLNAGGMGRTDYETETLVVGFNHDAQPDEMRFDPHLSASLTCSQNSAVAYNIYGGNKRADRPEGGFYVKQEETSKTLDSATGLNPTCAQGGVAIAYSTKLHNTTNNQAGKIYAEYTTALDCNSPPPVLLTPMAVRRLTPGECEKLQGFLPGYTAITRNGKRAADGPRYKALGNSMAVPVMAWIGRQIDFAVEMF